MTPGDKNVLARAAAKIERRANEEYDEVMADSGNDANAREAARRRRDRDLGLARDVRAIYEKAPEKPITERTGVWFMVPEEPTPEMLTAADAVIGGSTGSHADLALAVWRAMLKGGEAL